MTLIDLNPWAHILWFFVFTFAVRYIFRRPVATKNAGFWRSQACVGQPKFLFPRFQAGIEACRNTRAMMRQGHEQYSLKGLMFAYPRFAYAPVIILPVERLRVLLAKSDDEVAILPVLRETIQPRYTGDQDIVGNPFHINVVKNQLTRKLAFLTADAYEELVLAFQDQWNAKHDTWTAVPLYETCISIVGRGTNRVLAGTELCRNEEFLVHCRMFTQGIFMGGMKINLIPEVLKPFLAPLIAYPNKKNLQICLKHCIPVVRARLEQHNQRNSEQEIKLDAIQWLIEEAERQEPTELDATSISRRLIRLNMASIHTTSHTITNVLMDLYSSGEAESAVESLYEECSRVLAANGGKWTKSALNSLLRVDSVIKETMRTSGFGLIGILRQVANTDGVTLADGLHLPHGVRIASAVDAVHHDDRHYPNAQKYDPFRFSAAHEKHGGDGLRSEISGKMRILEHRNQSLVTTSETFLGWGYGRHSCPGRFFASQEMKLMLAHIVLTYQVKPFIRPKKTDFFTASIPSGAATISIKLR